MGGNGTPRKPEDERDKKGRLQPGHKIGMQTRFKPGNPGRPKRRSMGEAYAELFGKKVSQVKALIPIAKKLQVDPEKIIVQDLLALSDTINRLKGGGSFMYEQNQRHDGKVKDKVDVTHLDGVKIETKEGKEVD